MSAKKSKLYNYSPDQLQKMLDESQSFSNFFEKIGFCRKGGNSKTLKRIIQEYNLNTNQLDKNRQEYFAQCALKSKNRTRKIEDILNNKVEFHSSWHLLRRLVKEGVKKYECEICGIEEWNGKPISLQLHHKDGKRNNNELSNLQILCPNCHSQTETFGTKNMKNKKEDKRIEELKILKKTPKESKILTRFSKEELKKLVREKSFVQLGKDFNVSDNAIRKWCKFYKLPTSSIEIKKYTDEEWEKF